MKDIDHKLLTGLKDCPYKGKRKECVLYELRDLETDDRISFLNEMDEEEKVEKWQKHLECYMNAIAR
jgi:hypothetical protein